MSSEAITPNLARDLRFLQALDAGFDAHSGSAIAAWEKYELRVREHNTRLDVDELLKVDQHYQLCQMLNVPFDDYLAIVPPESRSLFQKSNSGSRTLWNIDQKLPDDILGLFKEMYPGITTWVATIKSVDALLRDIQNVYLPPISSEFCLLLKKVHERLTPPTRARKLGFYDFGNGPAFSPYLRKDVSPVLAKITHAHEDTHAILAKGSRLGLFQILLRQLINAELVTKECQAALQDLQTELMKGSIRTQESAATYTGIALASIHHPHEVATLTHYLPSLYRDCLNGIARFFPLPIESSCTFEAAFTRTAAVFCLAQFALNKASLTILLPPFDDSLPLRLETLIVDRKWVSADTHFADLLSALSKETLDEWLSSETQRTETKTREFGGWLNVPLEAIDEIQENLRDSFYSEVLQQPTKSAAMNEALLEYGRELVSTWNESLETVSGRRLNIRLVPTTATTDNARISSPLMELANYADEGPAKLSYEDCTYEELEHLVDAATLRKLAIISTLMVNPLERELTLSPDPCQKSLPPRSLVILARPVSFRPGIAADLPNLGYAFALDNVTLAGKLFRRANSIWKMQSIMYELLGAEHISTVLNGRKCVVYPAVFPDELPRVAERLSSDEAVNVYVLQCSVASVYFVVLHQVFTGYRHVFACRSSQLEAIYSELDRDNFVFLKPDEDESKWLSVVATDTWIHGV